VRPLPRHAFYDRHVPMEMFGAKMEELCFLGGPCRGVIRETMFSQPMKRRRVGIWCEMAASLGVTQKTAAQSLSAVPARSW
jgi:hypothetical protein